MADILNNVPGTDNTGDDSAVLREFYKEFREYAKDTRDYQKNIENYLCAKTFGIIISMIFTIIAYYTYSGVIGKNIDVVNIIIFILAVIIGQYVSYKKLKSKFYCNNLVAIIILVIIYLYFLVFTFYPPQLGLFKDPIDGTFGFYKK